MKPSIAKFIARFWPTSLLPPASRDMNGKRQSLSNDELREFFERNLSHRIERALDRLSPFRWFQRKAAARRLRLQRVKLFSLVGEIALLHAGIEQRLKSTLVGHWGVPPSFEESKTNNDGPPGKRLVIVEKLFGERLKKRFLKEIHQRKVPRHFEMRYRQLFEEFELLSQSRNAVLKTSYAFDETTAKASRVDDIYFYTHSLGDTDFEEWKQSWLPPVDFGELEKLRERFKSLYGKFFELENEVFRDKIDLRGQLFGKPGENFPAWAFEQPYIYRSITDRKKR